MFKIFVVTYNNAMVTSDKRVRTDVIEFETEEQANKAYVRLLDTSNSSVKVDPTKLY